MKAIEILKRAGLKDPDEFERQEQERKSSEKTLVERFCGDIDVIREFSSRRTGKTTRMLAEVIAASKNWPNTDLTVVCYDKDHVSFVRERFVELCSMADVFPSERVRFVTRATTFIDDVLDCPLSRKNITCLPEERK